MGIEEKECTPSLAMVIIQVGYAGMNVLSKLAMDAGMSPLFLITYRQIIATFCILPVAFFLERKTQMKITTSVLFQIFLCSLFGATINQLLYFIGLKYSSPTIASALSNMLPAITFVMAIPFRMETVGIRTMAGQAKVAGTLICVGGSMLMTFYKGSLIKMFPSHIHWKYAEEMTAASVASPAAADHNLALGAALVVGSCFAGAIWYIIQAKLSKSFAYPYTSSAIMCAMAGMQCIIISVIVDRNTSKWALGWDIRLASAIYTGVIGSGLAVSLMAWCIQKRGPLFVSMFSPLLLVIVAILGWAILDEKLYVGSVTGSVLIVGGLYMVLWGKGKEEKKGSGKKGMEVEEVENGESLGIGLPLYASATSNGNEAQGGNKA
ncbi:LOW QUALITY PROTEIN: WAT1-related protein At1g09380-like [Dioscorea cayenensis subsp. rotundata]|uniref:WAT1-related protein n=1 Tax=Dioscorea cayennensis subsp. rotundata TaxID=55577 RepID=A0AB40BN69_DIOCR|nr:LOW QUALITY PROTEIN: WAT1-related protein At1g09380-like [Dioscorea cayenensis subsp. rotundata]